MLGRDPRAVEQFPPQCHAASEGPAWALVGGGGGVMVVTTCRGWGSKETAKAVGPQEGGPPERTCCKSPGPQGKSPAAGGRGRGVSEVTLGPESLLPAW